MTMNDRLRRIRNDRNLTMKELSKIIGVPERSISNYELGENQVSINYALKIATYFGVNLNWLLAGEGEMLTTGPSAVCEANMSSKLNLTSAQMSVINAVKHMTEREALDVAKYIDVIETIKLSRQIKDKDNVG